MAQVPWLAISYNAFYFLFLLWNIVLLWQLYGMRMQLDGSHKHHYSDSVLVICH